MTDDPNAHDVQTSAMRSRYKVIDTATGAELQNVFVLLPESDSSARTALAAYAEATHKKHVANFIWGWLRGIRHRRGQRDENDRRPPAHAL